jgi:hypothetical protein
MYELLYSGFDTLYVAFQGALPKEAREILATAKERAKEERHPVLTSIGRGGERGSECISLGRSSNFRNWRSARYPLAPLRRLDIGCLAEITL